MICDIVMCSVCYYIFNELLAETDAVTKIDTTIEMTKAIIKDDIKDTSNIAEVEIISKDNDSVSLNENNGPEIEDENKKITINMDDKFEESQV